MVNFQTQQEIIKGLKLDLNTDKIPSAIPTIEVNPKIVKTDRLASANVITTGSSTIITPNPSQDIYIRSIMFSVAKDAACDVITGRVAIYATINGQANTAIASLSVITLTAERETVIINYNNLKIDRNTAVQLANNAYTAGLMSRNVIITYMVDEVD